MVKTDQYYLRIFSVGKLNFDKLNINFCNFINNRQRNNKKKHFLIKFEFGYEIKFKLFLRRQNP